jgi:hypothetical protein
MVQQVFLKAKVLEQKYIQSFASSCFNNLKKLPFFLNYIYN